MPDWVIHMAGTHAMARPLGRWDWRWVMLGAVFPDAIPRVIGTLVHKIDALEPADVNAAGDKAVDSGKIVREVFAEVSRNRETAAR